ncbi:MAG: replicative DNA helicase [Erysipelotrichaceae bacterium]|nr:replicative DNA helicase [Erysipelotrichaceae bacterium]
MTQKNIPYSIEAEESLLGNILLYKDAMQETMEAGITSEDFYIDKHKRIFNIMSSMYDNKEKIDTVSLSAKLKDFDYFEKVGGLEYLMRLTDATISNVNTKEYIRIIKNKSLSRQIIKAGEEIANDAYDGSASIDEVLDSAEKKILDITRSRTDADFKEGSFVFDETIKRIEAIEAAGSAITGVRSRFTALDNMTAGFQRGDLILVAARPSMGKSALALNIAINSAMVSQGACAIFSLEMPAEQLAMRMFSAKAKVDGQKLRKGQLNDSDWSKINEAAQELKHQRFFIDDTPGIKVSDMYAKCRKLKNDHGLYLVIVDYIQLIQASGRSESRQQEVSEISRRLKAMARELDVPVIALSQLSRSVESRQDKRPMLSDLRESGALEQDADIVLFIYRDEYYNREEENSEQREDVEIIVAKHRNGPTGKIKLAFEKGYNAFYSISNNFE